MLITITNHWRWTCGQVGSGDKCLNIRLAQIFELIDSRCNNEELYTAPLKLRKTESSRLKEIPLQMLPMGMWGPENMKIKKFRWGLFDF